MCNHLVGKSVLSFTKSQSQKKRWVFSARELFVSLIFLFSLLCLSTVCSFAIYKSEIVYQGLNRSFYLSIAGLAGSGIAALFWVWYFQKSNRFLVGFYICLGGVFTVTVEGILTYFEYRLRQQSAAITLDGVVPRILPANFFEANGLSITMSASPDRILVPLGGISGVRTFMCEENSGPIVYESDRYGLNNDDEVWDTPAGQIFIGDSFVQGDCVARNANLPSVFGVLQDDVVINLGIGGSGPLVQLAMLTEYAQIQKPEFIYWVFYEGNDWFDLVAESQSESLRKYLNLEAPIGLARIQDKIDDALIEWFEIANSRKNDFFSILRDVVFLKSIRRQVIGRLVSPNERFDITTLYDRYLAIIRKANSLAKEKEATLVFVYLPEFERMSLSNYDDEPRRFLVEALRREEIPVIDLSDQLSPEYFAFPNGGHFNEKGYDAIARAIHLRMGILLNGRK